MHCVWTHTPTLLPKPSTQGCDCRRDVGHVYCYPKFGIVTAGPWMCILGSYFLDNVVVQSLTLFIFLSPTPADDKSLGHITRALSVLKCSFTSLDSFYHGLPNSLGQHQRYFPHFRQFRVRDGTAILHIPL